MELGAYALIHLGSVATLSQVSKRSYLSKWIKAVYYLVFCICSGLICSLALPVLDPTLLVNFFHKWTGTWNEELAYLQMERVGQGENPLT